MSSLKDKVALITGAGVGIGRDTALLFADEGADVAICGRRLEPIQKTAADIEAKGRRALAIQADQSIEDDVRRMVDETVAKLGRLDILMNNASIVGQVAPVAELDLAQWNEAMAINLTGVMLCCREALRYMIPQGEGVIVNVSSAAGRRGFANRSPYASSKWAMHGFNQTLALEVAEQGIRVNAFCPGPVMTERLRRAMEQMSEVRGITFDELVDEWHEKAPMKRFATTEECAQLALFLASDASSGMTGQAINVTAGALMT
jgi:NAD(P)-dependent dehydrogenase (short-subunit alcohol dehydrogenase family)